ncbi:MAG: tubulin-like doman-containing protein [Selenomonadaceae bacterium]|nr:tubulin-like doman-containing protein [Selenomonadaceae bacterium]
MSYYFVSIGGTGAKVMESLTHLCIAGLLPENERLYITAIDPDVGNGNLERTSTALNNFDVFQNFSVGNDTKLFKNKISIVRPFPWNPTGHDKTLDDLTEYHQHSKTVGKLYEVLYTRQERSTTLNEGFRGHPSIGAAVLAKNFDDGSKWRTLTEQIEKTISEGDSVKIFLAGSVFGGTGAAGLPTVARMLRNNLADYANKISIGGVLILPYFSFTPEDVKDELFARSENFLPNTKAALRYYAERENLFDATYFVGDNVMTPVGEFSVGSSNQRNEAHVVELYAAMAAIDFFARPITAPKVFKYICRHEREKFSWNDFPISAATFVQFARFIFAYVQLIKPVLSDLVSGDAKAYKYPWFVDLLGGVNVTEPEAVNFNFYAEAFAAWLKQIETLNGREVFLINPSMFEANPARLLDKKLFATCDGTNSKVTLHEVWYRLTEPTKYDSTVKGFGKFLRRLYDACAAN